MLEKFNRKHEIQYINLINIFIILNILNVRDILIFKVNFFSLVFHKIVWNFFPNKWKVYKQIQQYWGLYIFFFKY
jgi:hypothetical protein